MHSEVCKWLFTKFGGKENTIFKVSLGDNDDYLYDVIDQPFHCEIKNVNGDVAFLLFIRSDFGIYEEQFANIHIVFHANGEKPSIISQNGIGGDANETAYYYLKIDKEALTVYNPVFGI